MRIVRDFVSCPAACKNAVVALGNFDGVHLGHRAILRECMEIAKREGVPSAVMTFEPHPREFFGKGSERLRIYSFRRKMETLRELGIDIVFLVRFNRRFSSLSAEDFVRDVLSGQLAVRQVITGTNFSFGKDRGGNADFLAARARELGFGFTACAPVADAAGQVVSSSAIRTALARGDVGAAATLLGRPYAIEGRVRHGEKRGRELGFPTANLSLRALFKPRLGIYAVRMVTPDGAIYEGAASIGGKPTFGTYESLLEVHAFGMDRDVYGQYVRVQCVEFLRDEARFDDVGALAAQIEADCVRAKEVLHGHRP